MPRHTHKVGVEKQKKDFDQASRALRVFRGLQPTLNAYVRMLTGKPGIRVIAATHDNGSTDGKSIYYRPPISLGAEVPHQRWMCDKRDEDMIHLCVACDQRESVLRTIFHEIAHIWFRSFDPLTESAKTLAIKMAIEEVDTDYGRKVADMIKKLGYKTDHLGYMGLAGFVSPYLPLLLNALEDARVNRELFAALPGTKVMFAATTGKVFREGVEQVDPKTGIWGKKLWSTYPLDAQAIVGILCMAQGYNFDTWLDPYVVHQLDDARLHELVERINEAGSMDTAFSLSFPVLARLRELGFCKAKTDPPEELPEPPPAPEDEEESGDDGSDGAGPPTPGDSSEGETEDQDTPGGGGDDSERDDDGGDGDESGPSDDRDKSSDEGDDVDGDDGEAGGDDSDEDPSGSSAPSEDSGADTADHGEDSGAAGGGTTDGEVPEEVPGDDDAGESSPERGRDAESDDSDGGGNGVGGASGQLGEDDPEGDSGDVDGLPGETDGDESDTESGGSSDDSSDDGGDGSGSSVGDDAEVDDSEVEAIDTGAAAENGGIKTDSHGAPPKPDIENGTPEEVEVAVLQLGDHKAVHTDPEEEDEHAHSHRSDEDEQGDEAVKKVVLHAEWFETPASGIGNILIRKEGDELFDDPDVEGMDRTSRFKAGIDGQFDPPETTIGPSVVRGRVVFSNAARTKQQTSLRKGRVHGPHLGRKAPVNDPRMMRKRQIPDKMDHFVGIGIDISGSTYGANLVLAKQVAFAEAEVLNRLGVPFFMFAHSGDWHYRYGENPISDLTLRTMKGPDEPWSDACRARLRRLAPDSVNLDGHTIEIYRQFLEKRREKVKILHYYTDGKMPAENADEELEILVREIKTYRNKGIELVGVGIRTDSPREHGLDTVEVHAQEDVLKVVIDLETRLTRR